MAFSPKNAELQSQLFANATRAAAPGWISGQRAFCPPSCVWIMILAGEFSLSHVQIKDAAMMFVIFGAAVAAFIALRRYTVFGLAPVIILFAAAQ
jgi:hypothetical protein